MNTSRFLTSTAATTERLSSASLLPQCHSSNGKHTSRLGDNHHVHKVMPPRSLGMPRTSGGGGGGGVAGPPPTPPRSVALDSPPTPSQADHAATAREESDSRGGYPVKDCGEETTGGKRRRVTDGNHVQEILIPAVYDSPARDPNACGCGRTFASARALAGHRRMCKAPRAKTTLHSWSADNGVESSVKQEPGCVVRSFFPFVFFVSMQQN